MKLKKLELIGFKSFYDKTTFDFSAGVTAIVGPNGCGKSNIVDAIRWVLGEHAPSVLRSKALEDVIFAGSDAAGPLGMAEVTLTFLNDDGIAPPGYESFAEIAITRRTFRDGESEFFINKVPCRLKDIAELFLDTGAGARGYAIIRAGEGRRDRQRPPGREASHHRGGRRGRQVPGPPEGGGAEDGEHPPEPRPREGHPRRGAAADRHARAAGPEGRAVQGPARRTEGTRSPRGGRNASGDVGGTATRRGRSSRGIEDALTRRRSDSGAVDAGREEARVTQAERERLLSDLREEHGAPQGRSGPQGSGMGRASRQAEHFRRMISETGREMESLATEIEDARCAAGPGGRGSTLLRRRGALPRGRVWEEAKVALVAARRGTPARPGTWPIGPSPT